MHNPNAVSFAFFFRCGITEQEHEEPLKERQAAITLLLVHALAQYAMRYEFVAEG